MADLKEFLMTHKTWTVLWIAVAIFWFVGFIFGCVQLSHNTLYDGRPFYSELFGGQPPRKNHDDDDDDVYTEIQNRNFPGWLVCAGLPTSPAISTSVAATCTQCIFTMNSSTTECADKVDIPSYYDEEHTGCYVFNGPKAIATVPTPMPNRSIVNCEFSLTNTSRARFYVFDQNWLEQRDHRWLFPDGIVQRTFPKQTRNLVELSRSKYNFNRGGPNKKTVSFFSYQLLDGESYPRTEATDDNITLTLYYGSPSEWRYTQYPYRKVWSQFGFYSWISYNGGLTFFCYFFQVGVYALLCKAMGWENDTASNYQTVN